MIRAIVILLVAFLAATGLAQSPSTKRMEIVSERGSLKKVKLYSGESLTFHAREKRNGLGGIFSPGDYLRGVTFTLRKWPANNPGSLAIVNGVNRRIVREKKPGEDLWGLPPSSFSLDGGGAGRFRLEAAKSGYETAAILIHLANFVVKNIDADLGPIHYSASFDLELQDPDEKAKSIPILLEVLSEEGQIVDSRDDVVLAPVMLRPGVFRSSRRLRLASTAVESFKDRFDQREEEPLPKEFFDSKQMRIVEGGSIRISFRNVNIVYPLPFR